MKEIIANPYPVTVADVKTQANVEQDFTDHDIYFQSLIEAAVDYVTGQLNCDALVTRNTHTFKGTFTRIKFNEAPFLNLVSVVTGENDIVSEVVVEAEHSHFLMLFPRPVENPTVVFTTGFEELPAAIRQAIIIKAADMYDPERNNAIIGVSTTDNGVIKSLLARYKRRYW